MSGSAGCLSERGKNNPKSTAEEKTPNTKKPLSEYSCPPYASSLDAVCSHTVDSKQEPIYIEPSPQTTTDPREIQFTLHNQSDGKMEFNPYEWEIYHQSDGDWRNIHRTVSNNARLVVKSHTTYTWPIEDIIDSINPKYQLKQGVYAFKIEVPDPSSKDWILCVSLIKILAKK